MKINEIPKRIKAFLKRRSSIDIIRDPYSDWKHLLEGFLFLVVIVVLIDGYIFYRIDKGELFTPDVTPATTGTVDRANLKRVADDYAAREQATASLASTTPVTSDPAE